MNSADVELFNLKTKLNRHYLHRLLGIVRIIMTTDSYINENKTATFKKGEKVVMHTCGEASFYKGKVWECQTDSYKDRGGQDVVFLNDFSGCFSTKYLQRVQV